MPDLDDEKRFIESGSPYKVKVLRDKKDWQGRWEYFNTKDEAIKAARECGQNIIVKTVPTREEISV